MSRDLPQGTPNRTDEYIYPGESRWRWILGGLAGGAVVLVGLLGAWALGGSRALNPGPVMAAHAPFEGDCRQCHVIGAEVEAIRCERCHDADMTNRLAHSAHVLLGSGDREKAAAAPELECMTCHVEHRGREVSLAAVLDRECAACHLFSDLDAHPEFAAAKAGSQTGLGMLFDHREHFVHPDSAIERCDACHEPTPDLATFEPISFELHCAGPCHTHQREDGTVSQPFSVASSAVVVPPPEELPPPYRGDSLVVGEADFLGNVPISGVKHREPWLVGAVEALGRVADPAGERARRAALRAQVGWLRGRSSPAAIAELDDDALASWRDRLERELPEMESRLALESGRPDREALAALRGVVQELGTRVAAADPSFAARWEERPMNEAPGTEDDAAAPDPEARRERRSEISRLLDAVVARTGERDPELADRAVELGERLAEIPAPEGLGPLEQQHREALGAHLDGLEEGLRVAAETGDPGARERAAQIRTLRELARSRLRGGLAWWDFERRRAELLELVDRMRRSPDVGISLAAETVRTDLLQARPSTGSPVLERSRLESARSLLARIDLELELREAGAGEQRLGVGSLRDRRAVARQLERLEGELADPGLPIIADAAGGDLEGAGGQLLDGAGCLKCHTMRGPRLAEVHVAEPVYRKAVFDHAPHVTVASCTDCHGRPATEDRPATGVWASERALDLNTPGVANCRSCHTPDWAGDDCELCHVYHPPTVERMLFP